MALSAEEQKLFDFALAALPAWFREDVRAFEFVGAAAKLIGASKATAEEWFENTLILQATGPSGFDPDWLNQHGADRGTARQLAELDPAYRDRIRNVPDALTRPTLLNAAHSVLGLTVVIVKMVEVRRDRAFFRTILSETGTGGTFVAGTPPDMTFIPTVKFASLRYIPAHMFRRIVISGAANPANDGTFVVTSANGNGADYANGSGVGGADGGVSWSLVKYDNVNDNLLSGFKDAYLSRGHRMGSQRPALILILPFGTTAGQAASVLEMLRQKKGAGVLGLVERRLSP